MSLAIVAGAIAGAAIAIASAAGMMSVRVARSVITPPRVRLNDVTILEVDAERGTIVLARTADTSTPGRYSLWFDEGRGHARVGELLNHDGTRVTRVLDSVQRGDISSARHGRWAGWWYLTPADLAVPFREVGVETSLGVAPAWRVDAESPTTDWVIQVHGRAVTRSEGLRAVPVFRSAGFTSLLISYRDDGDAPSSPDGRYALGAEEWLDVESAIAYARDHGARRIVLMGWSMGGATVLQCLVRSPLSALVTGVVLESPVIDWVRVLRFQASAAGLPSAVRDAALTLLASPRAARLVGHDAPIDFASLDFVARAHELQTPILLLHSDDDGFVPSDGSVALAAERPDLVHLERFAVARHTKLWNSDEHRWNRAISRWLDTVVLPAQPKGDD